MEEVDDLGGQSREMYGRHNGGISIGGPDAGSLTASGLWHQEEPVDNFYEKHGKIFTPLDSALGIFAPNEILLLEGEEPGRDHLYAYADPGFPLTRDFNPDLATFKAGPFYLDLISMTGTILYSDYEGEGTAAKDDGWLSAVSLAFRGAARLTDNLYLTASGEVYYLPGDNEVGFYFANGHRTFARIAYEDYIGDTDWEYVLFDEFGAYHRLSELFDEVEHDEIETAGRYRFGRIEDQRDTDYFDTDSLFFINRAGAAITGSLNDMVRASASYEHFDVWNTLDFDHARNWDRITARLDYDGQEWRIAPFFEYRLTALDDWDQLNHIAWLGATARISENVRAEGKVGYFKSTGTGQNSDRPVYELGIVQELGANTTHSIYGGVTQYLWEDGDNWLSSYGRYSITHRITSRLHGSAYVQYSDLENLDGDMSDRRGWNSGVNLTADVSDYTKVRLHASYADWDYRDPGNADRARWIYRAAIEQRILPYLYGRLLYQYEDFHRAGSQGYDEHLYMLSLTHLF